MHYPIMYMRFLWELCGSEFFKLRAFWTFLIKYRFFYFRCEENKNFRFQVFDGFIFLKISWMAILSICMCENSCELKWQLVFTSFGKNLSTVGAAFQLFAQLLLFLYLRNFCSIIMKLLIYNACNNCRPYAMSVLILLK